MEWCYGGSESSGGRKSNPSKETANVKALRQEEESIYFLSSEKQWELDEMCKATWHVVRPVDFTLREKWEEPLEGFE